MKTKFALSCNSLFQWNFDSITNNQNQIRPKLQITFQWETVIPLQTIKTRFALNCNQLFHEILTLLLTILSFDVQILETIRVNIWKPNFDKRPFLSDREQFFFLSNLVFHFFHAFGAEKKNASKPLDWCEMLLDSD